MLYAPFETFKIKTLKGIERVDFLYSLWTYASVKNRTT